MTRVHLLIKDNICAKFDKNTPNGLSDLYFVLKVISAIVYSNLDLQNQ